jgi:hypothetical protein
MLAFVQELLQTEAGASACEQQPGTPLATSVKKGSCPRCSGETIMPHLNQPAAAQPRLNWIGRLSLAVVFVLGMAAFLYAGLTFGMISGVILGGEELDQPGHGVGMAPDLSPLVRATFRFTGAALLGLSIGLLGGVLLMWLACRFLFAPLLRFVPGLCVNPRTGTRSS